MSGSPTSRDTDSPGPMDCDIVERVPLNSPKPAVVGKLKVNDVLDVTATAAGTGKTLVARDPVSNQDAGTLTPKSLGALLRCIERGNTYEATVVQVKGGYVEVEIRRV